MKNFVCWTSGHRSVAVGEGDKEAAAVACNICYSLEQHPVGMETGSA